MAWKWVGTSLALSFAALGFSLGISLAWFLKIGDTTGAAIYALGALVSFFIALSLGFRWGIQIGTVSAATGVGAVLAHAHPPPMAAPVTPLRTPPNAPPPPGFG